MTTHPVPRSLVVVSLVLGAGSAAAQTLPKAPCALLKPAEIQALAPSAKIGSGVPSTDTTTGMYAACEYEWGPSSREWGTSSVQVMVIDVSKSLPGHDPETIREGLLSQVVVGGPNASQIVGVGAAAAFLPSDQHPTIQATAEAYVRAKGVLLTVSYHGGNALGSKDKLTVLLKAAAARL